MSLKMFDIRRSQLRYAQKLNEIRAYFWETYKITKEDKMIPLGMEDGKWVDVFQKARTDFGQKMALTMSFVHGILFFAGSYQLLAYFQSINVMRLQIINIMVGIFYWNINIHHKLSFVHLFLP